MMWVIDRKAKGKRRTLPERVLGKSETMYIFFGAAKGPITFRTWSVSSFVSPASSFGSYENSLA